MRAALAVLAFACSSAVNAAPSHSSFTVTTPSELVATITVRCDACAWDVEGREAVVLKLNLDDRPTITLPVARSGRAEYRVFLGSSTAGSRTLRIDEDETLTARELRGKGAAVVEDIAIEQYRAGSAEGRALALAPFVYARPDTVGKFTDTPLFMWYEMERTSKGTRYRYSVIFTNEDGGTPTDRLMATWGRTTDIEYIYSVELTSNGEILTEDMQAPKHEVLPFHGRREGTHPLLWVSTSNNMVLDQGSTTVRYAPAPIAYRLAEVSREVVMDTNPWLYEVMAKELAREGKIVPDAPPGKGVIPDPRRYAFLEGCGVVGDNALAFALQVNDAWIPSDRGVTEFRIVRDGCFRAAVPLPANADVRDVRAVRVQAFERPDKPAKGVVTFTRLNTLFGLNERYAPGARLVKWEGSAELRPGGPPFDIPVP